MFHRCGRVRRGQPSAPSDAHDDADKERDKMHPTELRLCQLFHDLLQQHDHFCFWLRTYRHSHCHDKKKMWGR